MPTRTIDLQFPAGVGRRLGLRAGTRAQFVAPWAMNCRLEDSLTKRLRGGSFQGIPAGARPEAIVYRGRTLTIAPGSAAGQAVLASRVGDSTDTKLSSDASDMLRPALFQFSYAGEVGQPVIALIPHKDQVLLGFSATECWVQQGDPLTGPRRRVSDQVGIVGPNAWCLNHDTVYFLASHGLYSMGADGSNLAAVSEDVLPEDLTGVDDSECTLTYCHADRGVYIHKTGVDWFYDTARNQFWPFDLTANQSHVLIGPVRLGSGDRLGLLQTIHGMIADGSAAVTWRIVPGRTAEEAAENGKAAITAALAGESYESYVQASGVWVAGRSATARPRVEAMWVVVWLASEGPWAYEGITLGVVPSGSWRP